MNIKSNWQTSINTIFFCRTKWMPSSGIHKDNFSLPVLMTWLWKSGQWPTTRSSTISKLIQKKFIQSSGLQRDLELPILTWIWFWQVRALTQRFGYGMLNVVHLFTHWQSTRSQFIQLHSALMGNSSPQEASTNVFTFGARRLVSWCTVIVELAAFSKSAGILRATKLVRVLLTVQCLSLTWENSKVHRR